MYKENVLVRVINFHHVFDGNVYLVNKVVKNWLGDNIYDVGNIPSHMQCKNLEPVTHLTTKEFIKLAEDMGYECVDYGGHFEIRKNNCVVSINYKVEQYAFSINYPMTKQLEENEKQMLFKVNYIYANTPLELREEKEQLYTLELPNNNKKHKYYQHMYGDNSHYTFGKIRQSDTWKCYFTQKQIDDLDNQGLIKSLKQEPIKEND